MNKAKLLLIVFSGIFCLSVAAQDAASTDTFLIRDYDLQEAVVTSEKREMSALEVPSAISNISSVKIEQQRIESLRELNSVIPNLFMPQYGSKLTAPIYMRGIGARINMPKIGLYVDNIPYFDKSAYDFNLYNIERIEVLRGPQGTLYGRNALGGIIHVITRPTSNTRQTSLTSKFGNYGFQEYRMTHNQPIIQDKLMASISLDYRKTDGYFQNEFLDHSIDNMNEYSAKSSILFKPGNGLEMELKLHAELSDEGGYPYGIVDSTGHLNTPAYDHKSSYDRDLYTANYRLKKSFNRFDLTYVAGFQRIDDLQDIDQDFLPVSLVFVDQDQVQDLYVQEINLVSKNTGNFQWVTGLFGFYQTLNKSVNAHFSETAAKMFRLPPGMSLSTKHYDMANYSVAWFGQATLKNLIIDDLDFTLGLRTEYEKDRMDYQYLITVSDNKKEASAFDESLEFTEFIPKVALNYRWTDRFNQYISLSKGYQSGGFNTTFETEEGQTFDPEYAWNYEAGLKTSFLDNRLSTNVAFFFIDWTNQQIYQPVPSGRGSKLTNAGKSESKGFELEVSYIPFRNLVATFNLGYTDARFVTYERDKANNISYSGNYIPYIPKYTSQYGLSYRIPLKNMLIDEIRIHSTLNTIGKHYWEEENINIQDTYYLLNGGLNISFKWFDLSLWSDNMLNTDYRSFLFNALGNTYAQKGKPLTYGASLSVEF
jgi:outer membrane receptor protein involved in Fe transport